MKLNIFIYIKIIRLNVNKRNINLKEIYLFISVLKTVYLILYNKKINIIIKIYSILNNFNILFNKVTCI